MLRRPEGGARPIPKQPRHWSATRWQVILKPSAAAKEWPVRRGTARCGTRFWRNHGGADGDRVRHQYSGEHIRFGARLTATIAAELGETAVGDPHYQALFTIGSSCSSHLLII